MKSPNGAGANRLPPTVAMLRTAGPPIEPATGCRNASSRSVRIRAKVTPAPSVMREPVTSSCVSARSVARIDRRNRDIALVERAHDQRAAAEIARVAFRRQRRCRFSGGREGLHRDGHDLVLRCHAAAPQMAPDRVEPGLINLFANHLGDSRRFSGPRGEARLPMPEGPVTIGDRQQANMRDIVEHRNRRIEQAIAEALFEIGQRQQLLAQLGAVLQYEPPHAADAVSGLGALDSAGRDRGMPAVMAIEIAQHVPDRAGRRIEDRALDDVRHGISPRTPA